MFNSGEHQYFRRWAPVVLFVMAGSRYGTVRKILGFAVTKDTIVKPATCWYKRGKTFVGRAPACARVVALLHYLWNFSLFSLSFHARRRSYRELGQVVAAWRYGQAPGVLRTKDAESGQDPT